MKKCLIVFSLLFVTLQQKAQTVTDIDGNVYHEISIGSQIWMLENLSTTKLNDGKAIPTVQDDVLWGKLNTPAYCWYKNDSISNKAKYGALYNWYVVNTLKLCPTGWHVPSDAEWNTLSTYLGGGNVAGGKLKEAGTTHWTSPNNGADNSSGFTALAGGGRFVGETYLDKGNYGFWWASNQGSYRYLYYSDAGLHSYNYGKSNAFSVRCLKDKSTEITNMPKTGAILIYPNPATDKINILQNNTKSANIVLVNMQGKEVLTTKYDGDFCIDISSLPQGLYILRTVDSEEMTITKFIKK